MIHECTCVLDSKEGVYNLGFGKQVVGTESAFFFVFCVYDLPLHRHVSFFLHASRVLISEFF